MSMDLAVWSSRPFELPSQLPDSEQWKKHAMEWSFEGDRWHVLVVTAQDKVPERVRTKLPAARHVAYVTLEPIGADPPGYDRLEQTVRSLARQSDGVWVDPNGEPYGADEGIF